jgi:hypothetical protein
VEEVVPKEVEKPAEDLRVIRAVAERLAGTKVLGKMELPVENARRSQLPHLREQPTTNASASECVWMRQPQQPLRLPAQVRNVQ